MTLLHIVQFKFKSSVSAAERLAKCQEMLGLKEKCLRDGKPYIVSSTGGADNSIENAQNGYSHAFVVEFANEQDRNYYVEQDEAHKGFVKSAIGSLDGLQVLDYVPGKF